MHQIVIGTAGHIDHGKTALVEALTGTNTDSLQQEKSRGITIDLGFAYLNDRITIVDVPGHQKFIRNMVAGASTIHLGLLVIAADDGIMPQTLEHLHILDSLSILNGIIVLTKTDIVDKEWIDLVRLDINELKEGSILSNSRIMEVDSLTGKGIPDLKKAIISLADSVKLESNSEYFRMYIDRVFNKKGYGSVVTGTVKSGSVSKGDKVEILPEKLIATVRGIQTHGGEVSNVKFGDRAALNLSKIDNNILVRGSSLSEPEKIIINNTIVINIKMSKNTSWKIKNNQRLRIHIGTVEVLGRIILFKKELNSNQSCNAILHLENKIGITMDELFLVRSYSPLETIASGIVLDFGTKVNKELIDKYPTDRTERLVFMIKIHSNKPLTIEEWSKKYFISEKEFKTILKSLSVGVVEDGLVYLFEDLNYWKNEVLAFIKEKTNKKSFRNYVEMNNIAINLNLSNVWSHYIIKKLENDKVLKLENGKVKIVGQVNMIDKKLDEKINNIENIIKSSPKEIVSINELIKKSTLNPKQVKELIFFLNDNGKAKIINENIIISIMAFNSLIDSVEKHFKDSENMSVSNFKDLSGFSRKNAIPMLEYFDKNGFTIRNGVERMKGEYFFDEKL
tara:strand:- start:3260 stop:5125 length:1866 start_codon:yes stop_codon:yes gene_type:complete